MTRLICQVLGLLLCSVSLDAMAAEPRWPEGPYKYIVVDQAVDDVLAEFGRNIGVPVRASGKIRGRVSAGMPQATAREFLNDLCTRYGLVWHFDGSVLHVATEAEVRTEVFRLGTNTASGAAERLDALGVADVRFPIRFSRSDNIVSVSGPPSYVDLVQKTLGVNTAQDRSVDGERKATSVRVFRGRSAEAQSFTNDKAQ
ncbi:type III secretion protein [Nitratireductor pacificus]|uniref:Nodulation protein NolW n=1 Tax=Nitratireductor pacificus pht-3B TaxID=391937 RepID=K2LJ19_9HYPH|nr:type III secretion protein [Nitratireductor pacificus]EKF17694.1 nodulation protein NolW [Nitratireductor pacificus pht-3B]